MLLTARLFQVTFPFFRRYYPQAGNVKPRPTRAMRLEADGLEHQAGRLPQQLPIERNSLAMLASEIAATIEEDDYSLYGPALNTSIGATGGGRSSRGDGKMVSQGTGASKRRSPPHRKHKT